MNSDPVISESYFIVVFVALKFFNFTNCMNRLKLVDLIEYQVLHFFSLDNRNSR